MTNNDLAHKLFMSVALAIATGYITTLIPGGNPQVQRLLQGGVVVIALLVMAQIMGVF